MAEIIKFLNSSNPNAVQASLDVFAYAENIALRILSKSGADHVESNNLLDFNTVTVTTDIESADVSANIEQVINGSRSSLGYIVPVIEQFAKVTQRRGQGVIDPSERLLELEQRVWLNWPSNALHISTLFRLCEEWKWFELLWVLNNRPKDKIDDVVEISAFGIPNWKYYFFDIDDDHQGVIGPVILSVSESLFNDGAKLDHVRLLDSYEKFHQIVAPDSLTKKFWREDMERILAVKNPLSIGTIRYRISYIRRFIDALQNLDGLDSWCSLSVDGSDQLAQCLVTGVRLRDENSFVRSQEALRLKIPFSSMLEGGLDINASGSSYDRNIVNFNAVGIEARRETIISKIESWSERIVARRKNLQTLRVRMTTDWMNYHFMNAAVPNLSGYSEQDQDIHAVINGGYLHVQNERAIGSHVARVILEALRADICQIYEYISGEGKVRLIGQSSSCKQKGFDKKVVRKHMEGLNLLSLEPGLPKNEDSIVGKCIRDKQGTVELDLKVLSWPTDGSEPPKSAILTPIVFQDRVVGLIEVKSSRKNGFLTSGLHTLNHFAANFGHFYYTLRLIRNLDGINTNLFKIGEAGSKSKLRGGSLDNIAANLSSLYLSDATTIWLKKDMGQSIFRKVGHSGYNIFAGEEADTIEGSNYFSERKKADEMALTVRLAKYYRDGDWKDLHCRAIIDRDGLVDDYDPVVDELSQGPTFILSGDYFSADDRPLRKHRENIRDEGFRELRAFLLARNVERISKEGNLVTEIEVFGAVTLLYREISDLPHWAALTHMISKRLSESLTSKHYDSQAEDNLQGVHHHELKETLNSLLNTIPQNDVALQQIMRKIPVPDPSVMRFLDDIVYRNKTISNPSSLARVVKMLQVQNQKIGEMNGLLIALDKKTQSLDLLDQRFRALCDMSDSHGKYELKKIMQLPDNAKEYCYLLEVFRDSYFSYSDKLQKRRVKVDIGEFNDPLWKYGGWTQPKRSEIQRDDISWEIAQESFASKGIPKEVAVYAPAQLMRHVFNNIFQNIYKYATADSEVRVEWRRRHRDTKNERTGEVGREFYVRIYNDCYPEDEIDHIVPSELLKIGARLEMKRFDDGQPAGDGIGLFLVKKVCEQYGFDFRIGFTKSDKFKRLYEYYAEITFPEERLEIARRKPYA